MTNSRTGRRLVTTFVALLFVATACTPDAPPSGSPGPEGTAAATERPQQGGRIIEGTISDLATMAPWLYSDDASSRVIGMFYDTLIIQDAKTGEVKPRMATFTTSTDGLTYTFTINDKANWSDGKPVIAQDYITAISILAKSPKTTRKSSLQDIKGFNEFCFATSGTQCKNTAQSISGVVVDPSNPKKFTVTLAKASCPAIIDLGTQPAAPIPTHVFGKYLSGDPAAIDTAPEINNPTVTNGPFLFKEWRKGDQVITAKNPNYWQGAPHADEYVFKVLANVTAVANGLKTGEVTWGNVQAKDLADMQTADSVRIVKYPNLGYVFIGWNTRSTNAPALADKRVRQALAFGLDMDAIVKAVVFGEGTKIVSHHVPIQWSYPSTALEQYKYDKAKAEQLLRDAGWAKGSDGILEKEGRKFNLTLSTNSGNNERETVIQVAADQYKQLGINAVAKPEAFQGLVTRLTTGDQTLDATTIGWGLGGDPDPYIPWHSSQIPDPAKGTTGFGLTGFRSAELDKAIEEARNPSNGDCSTAARKKHYETFNKILNDNQPYNFGYSANTIAGAQKSLQSFAPGSYSARHNVHEWWIKK